MKTAAIIGCGKAPTEFVGRKEGWGIAYAHGEGYQSAFPGISLYAVDPNPENLNAFAEKFGIPQTNRFASAEALYGSVIPDAVSVCTWPALHVPIAINAIGRGVKAITVEKPVGLDGFQIQELIDTAGRHNARVAVAHQRRYEPWFVKARELIQQGAIGEKLVIEARVGDDWDVLSWTTHWFDMANYLFDAPPRSVLAGVDHTGQRRYGHAVENGSVVFADYSETRQAVFITGPGALPEFGFMVRGDKGMMVVGNPIKLWTTSGYQEIATESMAFSASFASLFAGLWQSTTGETSRCDISKCAPATLMAYAAHESARTMRRVMLPLMSWYAPLEIVQHAPTTASAKPLSIALLADAHHEWQGLSMSGRDGLYDALVALGHRVMLLDATKDLETDALAGIDLLVLYHTQQKTPATHRAVLEPWFRGGKPVVVSHCGIGAYADWPEFRKWIGRYWVWGGEALPPSKHPHVPCTVRVDDASRFSVPWQEAWIPVDEMYQGLGEASSTRPLATATAPDGASQLYAYQVIDHPNVVAWLPGHRRDMFTLDVLRDGLKASIELATTAKA